MIKPVTYYTVVCDAEGCEADAFEGDEYTAWADEGTAEEMFEAGPGRDDWQLTEDGQHLCSEHRIWDEES